MGFVNYLKSKKGIVDFGGILLLLLAGYLFLSGSWQYLYWIFTPRPPVLVYTEWKGSTMDSLYNDPVEASYGVNLFYEKNRYGDVANIRQITVWYANTQDARLAWQNPQKEISRLGHYPYLPSDMDIAAASVLDQFSTMPFPSSISIPSSIFCYNYTEYHVNRHTCIYFGYYEHWFTQIWFGEKNDYLDDKTMFELIEKAVQILIEAPPPAQ